MVLVTPPVFDVAPVRARAAIGNLPDDSPRPRRAAH